MTEATYSVSMSGSTGANSSAESRYGRSSPTREASMETIVPGVGLGWE
jgi:hypothetical protein